MADYNTNYQNYSGDLSPYLGKNFNYGQLTQLNSAMGQSAGNQPTFISGGNIYQVKDNGNNTFGLSQIDTVGNRQAGAAQELYQQQQGSAISGLQTQKAGLAGQYGSLLQTVTGEYQPLINQTTQTAGAAESARGLTPDSQLYQQQVQGALQPVYGAEAANAQQIGQGSIADTNTLAQAIAAAQQGGAQFGATLPLQFGSLSLAQQALPSQIAYYQGQGSYYGGINPTALQTAALKANTPFPTSNGLVFGPSNNQYYIPKGGGGNNAASFALAKLRENQIVSRPAITQIAQYAN